MPWNIFDYRDNRGRNVIKQWFKSAGVDLRAKADGKIQILRQLGPDSPQRLLAGTNERHIDKLRVMGNDNTRILCCRGPIDAQAEYTLLAAHPEKDSKLPRGAVAAAEVCRQAVIQDPQSRREAHEFEE